MKKKTKQTSPYLTVYIDAQLAKALARLKKDKGISKSFILRQALTEYLKNEVHADD